MLLIDDYVRANIEAAKQMTPERQREVIVAKVLNSDGSLHHVAGPASRFDVYVNVPPGGSVEELDRQTAPTVREIMSGTF